MKIFDILAILGALAWLPHLVKIIKEYFLVTKISIVTQRTAEIGFTTLGPILNLRLAFVTENRDIVISSIKIILQHESGEVKTLSWHGISQDLMQMRNLEGGYFPMEKEQSVLQ